MKMKYLCSAFALLSIIALNTQASLSTETIIEEDDARVTYTGNWIHKTQPNAHDGQYLAGKASAENPSNPGSVYINLSDATPEKSYWIEIGTLRHSSDWRSTDVKVQVYTINGIKESSYSQVGGNFEPYVVSLGDITGIQGIEISNATSDDRHVVFDYALVRDKGYPIQPGPVYQSTGDLIPSGPMGSTFVSDAMIEYGTPNFTPHVTQSSFFGRGIVMLDDKDGNGIKEFVSSGKIAGSNSFSYETEGTKAFIISTNSDGSVNSYQNIGDMAVQNTGFSLTHLSGAYIRPVGDFDSNGTSDILFTDKYGLYIMLLDVDDNNEYVVKGVVEISNGVGSKNINFPVKAIFDQSIEMETYGDADGNGVTDFTVRLSGGNKFHLAAKNALGYSNNAKLQLLILMNINGTIKEVKSFQKPTNYDNYQVAGDMDGDGIVDFIKKEPNQWTLVFMNADFTVKSEQALTVTLNGAPYVGGYIKPIGDVDNNGTPDLLINGNPENGYPDTSVALVLLDTNFNAISATKVLNHDDYNVNQYNDIAGKTNLRDANFAISDMDGDGDLDMIFGNFGRTHTYGATSTGAIHIRFYD